MKTLQNGLNYKLMTRHSQHLHFIMQTRFPYPHTTVQYNDSSTLASATPPVIVGHCATLEVQQLAGVDVAGAPGVLRASGLRVGHVQDVVAGDSQGSTRARREGHVDAHVERVSRVGGCALQLLQQRLIG